MTANALPGDVCAIPLGDGRYAFGRVLRDASIAVYRSTRESRDAPPLGERDFLFTVGVYDDIPGSTKAPVVGHDAFESEADEWPPPYKIIDPITKVVRVYVHGEIRTADDPVAAQDFEKAAVWDLDHLVDRIRKSLPQ